MSNGVEACKSVSNTINLCFNFCTNSLKRVKMFAIIGNDVFVCLINFIAKGECASNTMKMNGSSFIVYWHTFKIHLFGSVTFYIDVYF